MKGLKGPGRVPVVAALLLAGCVYGVRQPEPFGSDDCRVLGIAPGMSPKGVNEALGGGGYTIEVVQGTASEHNRVVLFWNANVEFTIAEFENEADGTFGARVQQIRVTGPEVGTARGLTIGDSLGRVRQLYGEPVRVRGPAWLYTGPERPAGRCVLEVETEAGKVAEIRVGFASHEGLGQAAAPTNWLLPALASLP